MSRVKLQEHLQAAAENLSGLQALLFADEIELPSEALALLSTAQQQLELAEAELAESQ